MDFILNTPVRRLRYSEKGFTLIEILLVLFMLSVMAAIVVPNAGKFMQSAKKGAAELELGSVQVAVYAAMASKGVDTIEENETVTNAENGGVINDDPEIDIDDYLQGGVARLKGTWTVNTTGLVTDGLFPADATAPHWVYEEAGTLGVGGDQQWEYQTP